MWRKTDSIPGARRSSGTTSASTRSSASSGWTPSCRRLKKPSLHIRRGIDFGHRDLGRVLDARRQRQAVRSDERHQAHRELPPRDEDDRGRHDLLPVALEEGDGLLLHRRRRGLQRQRALLRGELEDSGPERGRHPRARARPGEGDGLQAERGGQGDEALDDLLEQRHQQHAQGHLRREADRPLPLRAHPGGGHPDAPAEGVRRTKARPGPRGGGPGPAHQAHARHRERLPPGLRVHPALVDLPQAASRAWTGARRCRRGARPRPSPSTSSPPPRRRR